MSCKKSLSFLLLTFAFLILGARVGHACSCGRTPTVLDAYEHADVVVIVRVVSVTKAAKQADQKSDAKKAGEKSDAEAEKARYAYGGVISTETAVEKVYKGNLKVGDVMSFAQGGGADCIWTFEESDVGNKYLFYLRQFKVSDAWVAGGCGRSGHLESVNDDLLYLNRLDKARGRTRISGTLRFDEADVGGVAGRKVRITGAGKTHEVKTDENGVYEIYDLPAGKYTVEVESPHGWKVGGFWLRYSPSFVEVDEEKTPRKISIVLEDKKHAGLDMGFEIDNAVRGKVYDTTGKPMNRVCLNLVPVEEPIKYFYEADCTGNGGAFEMKEIPAGRYVLVINKEGKVTSDEPFGTFYYPNVSKREDATVFEIGAGDFIENLQIYVPKMEETITVEGVFLYSDGKPVVGESVEFRSEKAGEDDEEDAHVETDAKGRFSIKILKGQKGRLHGEMYTYVGEFENCPKLDSIIKQTGERMTDIKTPAVDIRADNNIYGVELKYPFPGCKKAKIE